MSVYDSYEVLPEESLGDDQLEGGAISFGEENKPTDGTVRIESFTIDSLMLEVERLRAQLDQSENSRLKLEEALIESEKTVIQLESDNEGLRLESLCDSRIRYVLNPKGMNLAYETIQEKMKEEDTVLVMFMDINGFKAINKSITETRADDIIAGYADHLVKQVRDGDAVGRMGGDEFCVVVNLDGIEDVEEYVNRFARSVDLRYEDEDGFKLMTVQSSVGYTKINKQQNFRLALQAANDATKIVKADDKKSVVFKSVIDGEIKRHKRIFRNNRQTYSAK